MSKNETLKSKRAALDAVIQEVKTINKSKEFALQKNKYGINFPHELMGKPYQEWIQKFTSQERDEASQRLNSLTAGSYSVTPIICQGKSLCAHGHVCPFAHVPLGLQCPVEQNIIIRRMEELMTDYQIDGFRKSDFILINRLVELELTDYRASSVLSSPKYQNILFEVTTGSTSEGELITNEILNPIFELKEKISREKMKIMTVLVGTRQEKYKKQAALKEVKTEEYANKVSGMSSKLKELEAKINKKIVKEIKEAEIVE